MKVSASLRRASITSLLVGRTIVPALLPLLFSSCAMRTTSSDQPVQAVEVQGLADSGNPVEAAPSAEVADNTTTSSARVLTTADVGTPGIELVDGQGVNRLIVHAGEGAPVSYKVSELSNPARIVIDVLNRESKISKTFDTSDAELVSRVRIGAHPDKSRIVVDLSSPGILHKAEVVGDTDIVLTLTGLEKVTALETASLETADSEIVANTAVIAETTPSEFAAPRIEKKILSQLKGLSIEQIGPDSNMLVADIDRPGAFVLKKTAPSEYVLSFKKAGIDPEAALTLVAPPNTGLIRSVRPTSQGEDVSVRIFSSPTALLTAKANGNKVVVTADAAIDEAIKADSRAQAKPEAITAADPTPAAEATDTAKNAEKKEEVVKESDVASLLGEQQKYSGRLISLDLQDTDIDNALRIIAEVSNLNIIASEDVTGKVTLRLIDVPWDQALDVILKTNGLDKVQEGNVIRIAPVEKLRLEREALKQAKQAEDELEDLNVKYVRVSYAKASDLKPLVETVISERGSVSYDERTNQLIVKDIDRGIKNVATLVQKIDLRTPQVLLETQIVEASRTLLRDLGSQIGFSFIQSPETGNPTGYNFPNSVNLGGSNNTSAASGASSINLLLASADGTKSLGAQLSALENEGRVRIVSRPAVATTNNKQAIIKSVEKIRVKLPDSGVSVATGQGASATGGGSTATETIEVGIVLTVTPQASPDYFVLLDIDAKSSTFGSTVVDGIPSEVERSATSSVLVSSGQTFAMGGIYKISDNDTLSGVPFFKDIPFIGTLFRRTLTRNTDEELLFFLTPRIIEGSFDDAAMKAAL